MSTQAEELERMVIRLVGDSSHYIHELERAEAATKAFAANANNFVNPTITGGTVQDTWRKQNADAQKQLDLINSTKQKDYQRDIADQQRAVDSLGAQRQRAYETNLAAQDVAAKQAAAAREANARAEMANAAKDSQRRAQEMAYNVDILEKAQKEAAAKQKAGQDFNRNLAVNSSKLENSERDKSEKAAFNNRQKLLDEHGSRQNKLNSTIADNEKGFENARRGSLFEAAKERQRLLDQTINDRQKRFEAGNRLALQTDQQAQRDRIRAEKDATKAAAQLQEDQADNRKKQAQGSARFGAQINQAVKGTATVLGATSAALGYFGNVAIDEYAKFNQAYTESIAIMGATPEAEKRVKEAALDLSKVSKFGPAELAKAFYYLASSGLDAEQSIAALPIVTNFATAGVIDLEKATGLLMTAQAAMGMQSKDSTENMANLTRVTNVLTKASTLSQGTVTDFAFAMSREAGSAARAFGKDIEETTALVMNFSRQGIKGEVAGSYVARLTRFLADRSVENQRVFKQLGVNVFDEQTGKMRNYADILDDLSKAFEGLSDQGRTAVLHLMGFEPRMQGAIMAAMGGGKQMRKDIESLRQASKDGFAAGLAEKQMTSFTNQMKLVGNQVVVAAIGIGEMLAPAFLIVAKAASFFLMIWDNIPQGLKEGIVYGTALFAVLAGGFAAVVAAVVGFNLLFGGVPLLLLLAVGAAIALVTGLGAIGGALFQQAGGWEMLKKKAEAAWEWLAPVRKQATEFFETAHRVGTKLMSKLYDYIKDKFSNWSNTIDWDGFRNKLVETIQFAEYTITHFADVWNYVWASVKYYSAVALSTILENIVDVMSGNLLLRTLKNYVSNWFAADDAVEEHNKESFLRRSNYLQLYTKMLAFAAQGNLIMLGRTIDELRDKLKADEITFTPKGIRIEGLERFKEKAKKDMEEAANKINEGFKDFKKPGGTFAKDLEVLPFPDEESVVEAGNKRGKDYVKGLDNGVKQAQASLVGSAEALSRILAYRDIIGEPDEVFKVHGGKKVEAVGAGTAAAQTWKEQLEALKGIRDNTGELLKKSPVKLENAELP